MRCQSPPDAALSILVHIVVHAQRVYGRLRAWLGKGSLRLVDGRLYVEGWGADALWTYVRGERGRSSAQHGMGTFPVRAYATLSEA